MAAVGRTYLPPFALLTYTLPRRNPYSIAIGSYITMRLQENGNVCEMSPASEQDEGIPRGCSRAIIRRFTLYKVDETQPGRDAAAVAMLGSPRGSISPLGVVCST